MNPLSKTLLLLFVKPFYKENAGTFVFVFTMMFCIISKVDGAGLYEYHYSLAKGILTSNAFLLVVLFTWLLYVKKFVAFVSAIIVHPQYTFLQVYNGLDKSKRFLLLLMVEVCLLLPVLLYALFITFVGIRQHMYLPLVLIVLYLIALCAASATWHLHQLNNPHARLRFKGQRSIISSALSSYFPFVLIRFVWSRQAGIWTGINVFTCGVLYLIARNNSSSDYDISLPFLFYNFGILANGVLLLRIKEFEETYLSFYRGLPVLLLQRLVQYAIVYCILFIPEIVTITTLTPVHLHFADAVHFMLCGLSLLLLMNSITFLHPFKMKEYIKILLAVFFIECIFLVTLGFIVLYLFLFLLAIILFLKNYYIFERSS